VIDVEQFNTVYQRWQGKDDLDPEMKSDLLEIAEDREEIRERFYKNLEFGTAGMRGLMGAGTNRMNLYMVRRTTQGLANYIKKQGAACQGVVIAYDPRRHSKDFALQAGLVLARNGIRALVFKEITATPILSYAVKALEMTAGIVVTASHNPKEYNGYKLYWRDGGQLTNLVSQDITEEIDQLKNELDIPVMSVEEAEQQGLLQWIDEEVLQSYLEKVVSQVLRPDILKLHAKDCCIVYTPFHGTGLVPVREALCRAGFANVFIVPEQAAPDSDFPTVRYPNPEDVKAFALALDLAQRVQADLVMGTDPDADRLGAAARNASGEYQLLSGNQIGALMIDYILRAKTESRSLSDHAVIIKTIVTSSLGAEIAAKYGIRCLDVLTGFKYIGEKIKEFETSGTTSFLFGYEESNGFLIHDFVRDKDSVQAALLMAEMTAYYKSSGGSLLNRLQEIFEEFGFFKEAQISYGFEGIAGQEKIARIMKRFRERDPEIFSGLNAVRIKDYLLETEYDLLTGKTGKTTLPKADVIHITREDKSWICIRPSGTEPKIKIYLSVRAHDTQGADAQMEKLQRFITKAIK